MNALLRVQSDDCENTTQLTPEAIAVYRVVTGFMVLGLLWKLPGFAFFYQVYESIPLVDEFFPSLLRADWFLAVAYGTVVVLGCGVFVTRSRRYLAWQSILSCVALFCLSIHQGSYNDVTFMTAWWSSAWLAWYANRARYADTEPLIYTEAFLANIIIAMILLGGGVGKWTAEYWSGNVLYEIYFVERDFWIFNLLRDNFSVESQQAIAKWYSRMVVILETGCFAALWCLPRRYGSLVAITVFVSIALFSNFYLFSVLLSPIGLATVGLFSTVKSRKIPDVKATVPEMVTPFTPQTVSGLPFLQ